MWDPGFILLQSVNRARMRPVKAHNSAGTPTGKSTSGSQSMESLFGKRAPSSSKPQSGQQHDKEHPPGVSLATGARANKLAEADL